MEEEKTVDPLFRKGFEHGYWLKRGNSSELEKLMDGVASHQEYHNGLKAGSKEAEREIFLESLQNQKLAKAQNKLKGPKPH